MRPEDQSMIEIVSKGELGELEFFRYFLSVGGIKPTQIKVAIYEAFELFKKLNQNKDLDYIYTSMDSNEKVFLITGKSSTRVMANFFFDFSKEETAPIKQVELVGKNGLYQFDTNTETAFYSNFIERKFTLEFNHSADKVATLYMKIKESASLNNKVNLEGEY